MTKWLEAVDDPNYVDWIFSLKNVHRLPLRLSLAQRKVASAMWNAGYGTNMIAAGLFDGKDVDESRVYNSIDRIKGKP